MFWRKSGQLFLFHKYSSTGEGGLLATELASLVKDAPLRFFALITTVEDGTAAAAGDASAFIDAADAASAPE